MELELQGRDGQETVTVDNLGKVLKIDEDTVVPPVAETTYTLVWMRTGRELSTRF